MRSRIISATRRCLHTSREIHKHYNRPAGARWSSTINSRQWSSPLAKTLAEAIEMTGPISVATYMRQCLTSDLGGYYTSKPQSGDQFGRKGDFITSPEISQVFGELVGLWIVAEWMAQGKKRSGIQLLEFGPGRGTLMDDVLRTITNFQDLLTSLERIYLIEASSSLRATQHKLLCGDNTIKDSPIGYESISKYGNDIPITWTEDIRAIPPETGKSPFMIAHEFFDALPIHVFQSVNVSSAHSEPIDTPTGPIKNTQQSKVQWLELMVQPVSAPSTQQDGEAESSSVSDFELIRSNTPTPHALYLPEQLSRYKSVKEKVDATIEICPEAQIIVSEMATRIGGGLSHSKTSHSVAKPSGKLKSRSVDTPEVFDKRRPTGAALIIDYGPRSAVPSYSLRGIKAHQHVNPFTEAGKVDLSADVDFGGLAEVAVNASHHVDVHGPVDQARFLTAMGGKERVRQLIEKATEQNKHQDTNELESLTERLESGWKRLVDTSKDGMGGLYQVMAIVPHYPPLKDQPITVRRPVGFGGDIKF